MKIKKIIIFYPAYENGGATKVLQNLITFFTYKKIQISLISCNASYSNFNYKKNYFKILKPKTFFSFFFFQRIVMSLSVLKVFLKELIVMNRQDTIVFSMQSHLLSTVFVKIFNKRIVIRNSEDPFGATIYADEKIFALFIFLTKFISFNLADGIITNSSESLKNINFFLINKKKIKLIFNPYLSKCNKIFIRKKKKNIILAIGRLTKQKNFTLLINAFKIFSKKYKNYKLVLIGSGKDENKIKNLILNLGLNKKIVILKWKKNLNFYFRTSKFFVLPSLYEGSPNILIQAVDKGIPCISSDCSGARDILLNGKMGIIYKKNNKIELIKSMNNMHNNFNFFSLKSIKYANSSQRFLIGTQATKYFEFISRFVG